MAFRFCFGAQAARIRRRQVHGFEEIAAVSPSGMARPGREETLKALMIAGCAKSPDLATRPDNAVPAEQFMRRPNTVSDKIDAAPGRLDAPFREAKAEPFAGQIFDR